MIDDNLLRKVEKDIYIDILEISNIEFQKKLWFSHYKNYFSTYADLICDLFDDNQFDIFIQQYASLLHYTLDFIRKLSYLRDSLKNFNKEDNKSDIEIINNPQWIKISKLAKEIIDEWTLLPDLNGVEEFVSLTRE
jgi:hypothetical protein